MQDFNQRREKQIGKDFKHKERREKSSITESQEERQGVLDRETIRQQGNKCLPESRDYQMTTTMTFPFSGKTLVSFYQAILKIS